MLYINFSKLSLLFVPDLSLGKGSTAVFLFPIHLLLAVLFPQQAASDFLRTESAGGRRNRRENVLPVYYFHELISLFSETDRHLKLIFPPMGHVLGFFGKASHRYLSLAGFLFNVGK